MTINERFKEIRLNLNKTQADFGEQCGLGRADDFNFEHDYCGIQNNIKRGEFPATDFGFFLPRFAGTH